MDMPKENRSRGEDSLPPLLPGDIILVRHKRHLARRFLRRIFGSYWDHAVMVIFPRDPAMHLSHTIVSESIRERGTYTWWKLRGVSLRPLTRFLSKPGKYDIGVKRVPGLTDEERERVVKYMLMNVDAPYWTWSYLKAALAAFFPPYRKIFLARQRFSCSGFIQQAFFDSVEWDKRRAVIFRDNLWSPIELQELITPADIARSDNAVWLHNEH
jgi:hypothetical protein